MRYSDLVLCAALVVLVGCSQGKNEAAPGTTEQSAGDYINLSLKHYQDKEYQACIDAANQALKLEPDSAVAYNNIAACQGAMGRWDEEIAAAQQALRIAPDFALARNNLAWAESQKKLSEGKGQ